MEIRAAAVTAGVPCVTTRAGISAVVHALVAMHRGEFEVKSVQEHHLSLKQAESAAAL